MQRSVDSIQRWEIEPVSKILAESNFDLSLLSDNINILERGGNRSNNQFNDDCGDSRYTSFGSLIESTIFRNNFLNKFRNIKIEDDSGEMVIPKYSAFLRVADSLKSTKRTRTQARNSFLSKKGVSNDEHRGPRCSSVDVRNTMDIPTTYERGHDTRIPVQRLSAALQNEIDIVNDIRQQLEKVKALEKSLHASPDAKDEDTILNKYSYIEQNEEPGTIEKDKHDLARNLSVDDGEADNYSDSSFLSE